jgi:hypothetical protein
MSGTQQYLPSYREQGVSVPGNRFITQVTVKQVSSSDKRLLHTAIVNFAREAVRVCGIGGNDTKG